MRIAKTVCITLPPDLLKKAEKLAAREHRTMSELFREALRHYMSKASSTNTSSASPDADRTSTVPGDTGVLHSFRMEK